MSPHIYALSQCIKFHYKAAVVTAVVLKLPWGFACSLGFCRGRGKGGNVLWYHCQSCRAVAVSLQKKQFYAYAADNY